MNASPKHNKIAILLPGFLDSNQYENIKEFASVLNDLNYSTLQLDPCGLWYGKGSDKTYTMSGYLADIKIAVDEMLSYKPNAKDVLLLGHSLGAFLAIVAASQIESVKTVCSLCPPAVLQGLIDEAKWQETGFKTSIRILPEDHTKTKTFNLPFSFAQDAKQYNNSAIDAVKNLSARLMIGISLEDETVPPEETEKLVSAANNPYVARFEGLDHHFNRTKKGREKVCKEIAKFLGE